MLKQPVTQVRLTNVAVIRLKRAGKRFEIACYKNKILNWRGGSESDISEVLQTDSVFTNVSKGQLAKSQDLQRVFGTRDMLAIAKIILDKGELQVSEKERDLAIRDTFRDICTFVTERIFNRQTCLPLPLSMVESSLINLGFSISFDTPAKRQSLKAIDLLCKQLPHQIARTQMALRITTTPLQASQVKSQLEAFHAMLVSEQTAFGTAPAIHQDHAEKSIERESGVSEDQSSRQTVEPQTDEDHMTVSPLRKPEVSCNSLQSLPKHAVDESSRAQSTSIGKLENTSIKNTDQGLEVEGDDAQQKSAGTKEIRTDTIEQDHPECAGNNIKEDSAADLTPSDQLGMIEPGMVSHYTVHFLCIPTYYRDIDYFVTQTLNPPGHLQVISSKECIVNPADVPDDNPSEDMLHVGSANVGSANAGSTDIPRDHSREKASDGPPSKNRAPIVTSSHSPPPSQVVDGSTPCRTCEIQVQSVAAYRHHCKTDWHQFNVKRKFKKLPPTSLEEFEDLAEDLAEGFLAVD